jgi:hypothetical protein
MFLNPPSHIAMQLKQLFIVTALTEALTGLALVIATVTVVRILLGALLDMPGGTVAARVAGAALLAIGVACWLARDDAHSRAGHGLVAAMPFYNVATVAVLAYAGLGLGATSVALWPVVGVHAALAVWCIACLQTERNRSTTRAAH